MFRKILKLKTFWTVFVLASVVFYVAFLNLDNIYSTRTDILIIPKSGLTTSAGEETLGNLESITHSLVFFDGMIKNNSDVVDETIVEWPDAKRKNYWNSKVKTKKVEGSGILEISTTDKNRYESYALNSEAVSEFLRISGVFYNLKTDLEVRIIDRAITSQTAASAKIILLAKSLIAAFILALVAFGFSFWIFEKKNDSEVSLPKKKPHFVSWRPRASKAESQTLENIWQPEEKEMTTGKTAVAPANLPIAETESEAIEKKEEVVAEKKSEKNDLIIREATPEEVKERLNKLLSGGL